MIATLLRCVGRWVLLEVDEPVPEHLFELVIDVLKAVKEVAPAERARP